ncbi:dipeptidase [Conexibacter stalactiti]|uniref:Dipeptidase n=1 Tax=Conexibacter stalactiti TaxID=1940611 RepID=A0ABU4HTN4_9ACTN|nr:dipeptidase [Conexibacter stalactiti]MDW5596144.1 dipeptidase [Conexibacter stalactiti]MEC5036786.1 dipeptidase [Conexibacter stalactiti]
MLAETIRGLMGSARDDLAALVAFRSVADPQQFPAEECIAAGQYVIDRFKALGFDDARFEQTSDGHPAVFGTAAGPLGAPTVLLYCHYDVQPPLGDDDWESPVFELTERDGRWYGRGAADCKGNIALHLTALRALRGTGDGAYPVNLKLISEGAEEQGTDGMERLVRDNPELLRADAVIVADTGNVAAGVPTLTTALRGTVTVDVTVRTLATPMHSGMFGGPAPDALVALVKILATLHDEHGNTTVEGLDATQRWSGVDYPPERFRADANVLDGVELVGDGAPADMLWARPALTVLGIDCPPVVGSSNAVPAAVRARLSLRVPPGTDPVTARDLLVAHVERVAPWGVQLTVEPGEAAPPFAGLTGGPAYDAIAEAMHEAYGRELTTAGAGGSIPLCSALAETFPDAEILLLGVEEPTCLIHAPNESVDPREIERLAHAEARFLQRYAETFSASGG